MKNQTLAILLLLPLTACGSEKIIEIEATLSGDPVVQGEGDSFLDGFYREDAPAGAVELLSLREGTKEGAEVVVAGRVKDFVDGLSALVLTAESLEWCGRTSEENCETPWDYCCVDSAEVSNASATIEVHDKDGGLATEGLKGWKTLDYLDRVVVAGTFHKDDVGNMSIHASSVSIAEKMK